MALRNWQGILCCGITGSDSGFQAQSWHKQSYVMVSHTLHPSPTCLSYPPPKLCFALFSEKSTLLWIPCQGNICVLCIPSSKVFVMITTQLMISFLSSSSSFGHGADFCFTHSVSNVYKRPGIFNDSYGLSRFKFPLVLPSSLSLLFLKKT